MGVREGNWALNVCVCGGGGATSVCCVVIREGCLCVSPHPPSLAPPLSRPPAANLSTPLSQVVVGTTIQWSCRHQPGQGAEDEGCCGWANHASHTPRSTAQGGADLPLQPSAPACLPACCRPCCDPLPPSPPPNAHLHLHLHHRLVLTRASRLPTTCAPATTQSVAALRAVKQWRGWARTPPLRHA